jgi:hypothetical protein
MKSGQVFPAAIVAEKRRSKDKRVEQAFRPAVKSDALSASPAEVPLDNPSYPYSSAILPSDLAWTRYLSG